MPVDEQNEVFNEWSQGVSLANSDYFQEVPTELDNPANFVVPDQPVAPEQVQVLPAAPEQVLPVDDGPEVIQLEDGGTVTIEKTSKGWKAILDSGTPGVPQENFYGGTWRQLLAGLAKGKLEASKTIKKLKKEKLLGGDENTPLPAPVSRPLKVSVPTADEVYAVKNKFDENIVDGFDEYFRKRFGVDPEVFAEKLKSADGAERIVNAQIIKKAIDEVNGAFVRENPDYIENYTGSDVWQENARLLISRISKTYLNKKISKKTPDEEVDNTVAELYSKGFWTVENLETAKDELIDSELLKRSTRPHVSTTQPQQVAAPVVTRPSEPPAPRIAATPGQPMVLGFSASNSSPSATPEPRTLTDTDLQSLPMEQLRKIAAAQIQAMRGR